MPLDLDILYRFKIALEGLADRGKREILQQGHRASGRGIESIEGKVTEQSVTKLVGVILANDYLVPVDTGVPSNRVPYRRGSGTGRSKYIEGLLDWVDYIKPGLTEKARRSFVFAVANTHVKEGIPSRGSYSFTQNGRRTEWIKAAFEQKEAEAEFEATLDLINLVTLSFERAIENATT